MWPGSSSAWERSTLSGSQLEDREPCREAGRVGKPIAVCHVASGDRWAGAESQLAYLLRALVEHDDLHLCAAILNEGRLAEEIRACGIEVVVIPESKKGILGIATELAEFSKRREVKILHAHRYKENLVASIAARRCGIRHVVRSQHGMPEPFSGMRRYKQRLAMLVDSVVQKYCTERVIAVSRDIANLLARRFGDSKAVMIHNGIEPAHTSSLLSVEEAKMRLGIDPRMLVVGAAGRLEPAKRMDLLVQAAREIADAVPNTRILIVGDGSEMPRLRDLVHTLRLDAHVLFLGHRDDIFDVLRAMDVYVLCSDHEGLPMVLLEAMAMRIAVAARRVGGIPEVVADGDSGVLVDSAEPGPLASACVRLLRSREERQRLGAAGEKVVERSFTIRQCAAEVASLYRSLFPV